MFNSGIGSRSRVPSVIGFSPSEDSRIAFSTALTIDRSQTWTDSILDSGTLTVASWFNGMVEP